MRSLRQGDLVVSVEAALDDLVWLHEFLGPGFAVDEDAAPHARVAFVRHGGDAGAPRSYPGGDAVVFTLDAGSQALAYDCVDGARRFVTPLGSSVLDVRDAGREVDVAHRDDRPSGRFVLARVVREYAHNFALRDDALVLHAACVDFDGFGVAIAGDKGAGKTTLLARMLTLSGAAFVSNDRLLVRLTTPPRGIGMPTVVAVQAGTRELLPALTKRLAQVGDFRLHAREREALGPCLPRRRDEAWHVNGAQLCAATGRAASASAPLGAIVFPERGGDGRHAFRPLTDHEAARAIRGGLLGRRGGRLWSDVFVVAGGDMPSASEIDARCRALATSTPCFTCSRDIEPTELLARLRSA